MGMFQDIKAQDFLRKNVPRYGTTDELDYF
jgi:hypothetical protein